MILAVYSIMEVKKDEQEKSYNYYYFAYMLISIVDCTIVRAGTHSSHFALNGGASATLGNIIILNKELQTTQTI